MLIFLWSFISTVLCIDSVSCDGTQSQDTSIDNYLVCVAYTQAVNVMCSSNGAKSGSGSQPLVQWTEVHNHPGLICCITQTSNTPVVMMVKPDTILVQEIKIQPAKAKVCSTMS